MEEGPDMVPGLGAVEGIVKTRGSRGGGVSVVVDFAEAEEGR